MVLTITYPSETLPVAEDGDGEVYLMTHDGTKILLTQEKARELLTSSENRFNDDEIVENGEN